mmetsp:Transcript_24413/g.53326  ORF Transcript_24413/g.53326 Transcript_24413/m.53326 type:complete len:257 (+) Transcript_24413:48-818(+)
MAAVGWSVNTAHTSVFSGYARSCGVKAFLPVNKHASGTVRRVRGTEVIKCVTGVPLQKPKLSYVGVVHSGDGLSPDKTQWAEQIEGNLVPPRISKADDTFAKSGLEFVEGREGLVLTELNDLFEKVGFPRRDPEKLKIALENTHALIWVRSTKQSRLARMGQLVGFARATSDGVLSATIWDVAVNPAWQRNGLGRAMIERLTRKLVEGGIPTITLYAEPNVVGLYEKLGFVKDPEGIRGMAFQRQKKEKQPALARR